MSGSRSVPLCPAFASLADLLVQTMKTNLTVPARGEPDFAVVRYKDKVPAMASCAKCQRKFFTPNTYYNDAVGAFEYLRSKFDRHQCNGESHYEP